NHIPLLCGNWFPHRHLKASDQLTVTVDVDGEIESRFSLCIDKIGITTPIKQQLDHVESVRVWSGVDFKRMDKGCVTVPVLGIQIRATINENSGNGVHSLRRGAH